MMTRSVTYLTAGLMAGALALKGPDARAASSPVETRVTIHYVISMIGVSIGQMSWAIDLGAQNYRTSANGKASGALSMLVNGEGRVAAQGTIGDKLSPTIYSSNLTEDGETSGLQMTFESGSVKTLRNDEPPKKNGRIPVTEAHMRGVTDPLSGMLIAAPAGEASLTPAHCERVVPVFDGQRRYDLALSFKRMDRMKIERGYAGPVLVCAVVLHPIAGYRADSLLVKYVGGRAGMEIWFVPVENTHLMAPGRLVMPTLLGTLEIAADRFESAPAQPAGVPANPPAPAK